MSGEQLMRRKRGWMNLKITNIVIDTHDTKTFEMIDAEDNCHAFDYKAGQYLTFRFDDLGQKPVVRSYTMSSSPSQNDFSAVTVKQIDDGVVSNYMLDQLKVGDTLRARGPIGKFCYVAEHPSHLKMIAGGSGVTPFISIMREFKTRLGTPGAPQSMSLLVFYRTRQDIIGENLLKKMNEIEGVDVKIFFTREPATEPAEFGYGHLTPEAFLETFPNIDDALFMTCGPQGMMDQVAELLNSRGFDLSKLKTESFAS